MTTLCIVPHKVTTGCENYVSNFGHTKKYRCIDILHTFEVITYSFYSRWFGFIFFLIHNVKNPVISESTLQKRGHLWLQFSTLKWPLGGDNRTISWSVRDCSWKHIFFYSFGYVVHRTSQGDHWYQKLFNQFWTHKKIHTYRNYTYVFSDNIFSVWSMILLHIFSDTSCQEPGYIRKYTSKTRSPLSSIFNTKVATRWR